MSVQRHRKVGLALTLVLWMSVAPGCSWFRSVGHYYGSGEWYEDVETVAAITGVVAVVSVIVVGISLLASGQDPGTGARASSYLFGPSPQRSGRSRGYSYSDYYRSMSR